MYPAFSLSALHDERVVLAALGAYAVLLAAGTVAALVVAVHLARHPVAWEPRRAALAARAWRWPDLGFAVLCFLGLQFLALGVSWLATRHGWLPRGAAVANLIVESVLLDGAGLLLLYVYLRLRGVRPLREFGLGTRDAPRALRTGAVTYVAMLPLLLATAIVYQAVLYMTGHRPDLQDVAQIMLQARNPGVLFYLVLLGTVLAPLYEECLFRGLALPLLMRHIGTGPAIVVVSLVFAAVHLHLPSFAPLFVVAVMFSMAYLYTGSLWTPIVMHSLFNGVNLALLWIVQPTP